MLERILPKPSATLWSKLMDEGIRFTDREREAYSLGKLAVLLELETHVRLVEDVSGVTLDDRIKFTVSGSLRDVQRSVQMSLNAHNDRTSHVAEWYDFLLATVSDGVVDAPLASPDAVPENIVPLPPGIDAFGPGDTQTFEPEDDDLRI